MSQEFFPKKSDAKPTIYAYELPEDASKKGLIKVGYTTRDAQQRIKEQIGATRAEYRIVFKEDAMRNDGSTITDHDIHRYLRSRGYKNTDGEWFECSVEDLKAALYSVKTGEVNEENRSLDFGMRPEQKRAVEKTAYYFKNFDRSSSSRPPEFLWNAKMRFGKTFAAYQLAKEMGWNRILVLTFKPAVENAWQEDLLYHVDFKGWQFISKNTIDQEIDENRPVVCFGSFQDFLGKNKSTGGIKTKNEWVHATKWDCVIFDEYHFGAWNEKSKSLFEELHEDGQDEYLKEFEEKVGKIEEFDPDIIPINSDHFLYLSGTPFRALNSGEFIEEQIFNWTYSDEQKAKEEWQEENNPYKVLPRMVMLTYQMPDSIKDVALGGEFNEFDLNTFFEAKGEGENARFVLEDYVQKWLDLIRGAFSETTVDDLKMGAKKPPMPFSDSRLLSTLNHTFWFLPSVASCHAMKNLMDRPNNKFYHDYRIVVAAGSKAGIGADALKPVRDAMGDNPLETKTITLSCGKLTNGVSVKPWSGIFMLRNLSSPETYFQAAFRVQTPWAIKNPDGESPNKTEILKKECYVFDFAPNRALNQVADYACRLNAGESNPEEDVDQFIQFLPILAYDGSSMKQVDAAGILDIAMSGTSATLLAKRWESALLVNVDNKTLENIKNNEQALNALMNIEGFRSLNQDIETIINKSEAVKKAKKEKNDEKMSQKEKKELSDEEKEYKSLRKQVQEKLIKFSTRIPVFMYLTDYREKTLKDVITQLEPGLFKKVTGLNVEDFHLLVSLGVFNSSIMNDAVYKFKRYEDASLEYTGINRHEEQGVGGFDTVLSKEEYNEVFVNNSS